MTTRRDYVDRIAQQVSYPKAHIERVIDLFLDELVQELATEGRVELRNFGVFRVVTLPARTGRNPRTGAPVDIPEARHVRFRGGKQMRERLN